MWDVGCFFLLHHFITYIVVTHETRFQTHTFRSRQGLSLEPYNKTSVSQYFVAANIIVLYNL